VALEGGALAAGGPAGWGLRSVRVDDEPGLALSIAEALTSAAPTVVTVGTLFA